MLKSWVSFVAVLSLTPCLGLAANYEGEAKTQIINRTGKDLVGSGEYPLTIQAKIFRLTVEEKEVPVVVYDCEAVAVGNGRAADWQGFFQASRDQKGLRLSQAIMGLDLTMATQLVQDGTFTSKPRSWMEFQHTIGQAERRYRNGFSYAILVTFKQQNMTNLGYLQPGQPCPSHTARNRVSVPHRELDHTESRTFLVRVSDMPLLVGESEKINVTFDGIGDQLTIESDYNDYTTSRLPQRDGSVVFEVHGRRRVINPTNSLNVALSNRGGTLLLSVSDTAFDRDTDSSGSRKIIGTVEQKRWGWHENIVLAVFERTLSNSDRMTEIGDLGVDVPKGKKIVVRYELRYENNPFFTSNPSTRKEEWLKN